MKERYLRVFAIPFLLAGSWVWYSGLFNLGSVIGLIYFGVLCWICGCSVTQENWLGRDLVIMVLLLLAELIWYWPFTGMTYWIMYIPAILLCGAAYFTRVLPNQGAKPLPA